MGVPKRRQSTSSSRGFQALRQLSGRGGASAVTPRFVGLLDDASKPIVITTSRLHNRFVLPNRVEFHRVGTRRVSRQRSAVERLHVLLSDPNSCRLASWVSAAIMVVIFVSCVNFVVATEPDVVRYPSGCGECSPLSGADRGNDTLVAERELLASECRGCEPTPPGVLDTLELTCIVLFTVEYTARLLSAHAVPAPAEFPRKHHQPMPTSQPPSLRVGLARTRGFVLDAMNLVDLVAILPFYLTLVVSGGPGSRLSVLRVIRLFRVFRVLKIGDLASGVQLFTDVGVLSGPFFLTFVVFSMFATVVLASLVYFAEAGKWKETTGEFVIPDPITGADTPSPFTSILVSCWWTLVTFTLVGFGDMSPVTWYGQVLASICMYTGVVLLAIPVTIMGYNLTNLYQEQVLDRAHTKDVNHFRMRALLLMCQRRQAASLQRAFNSWVDFALGEDSSRDIVRWEVAGLAVRSGLLRPQVQNVALSALSVKEAPGKDRAGVEHDKWEPLREHVHQTSVTFEEHMERHRRHRMRLLRERLGRR